ncbi:hypothetical protein EC396_16840 [Lutibacter sp. HS1-25]|nr:hypothetical protein EC396_16840 [Lutibacter sp. HS1-25]
MAFSMHKYYISLCEIEYAESKQAVQIILGIFIDDLEVVLNKEQASKLNLATEKEPKNINAIYLKYLNNNFKIKINNTAKPYRFIGKKYDDDIVRFYLEIPNISQLNSIEVFNTSLVNEFENQQNIIKIKVNKLNKSYYLDKNNISCLLKI